MTYQRRPPFYSGERPRAVDEPLLFLSAAPDDDGNRIESFNRECLTDFSSFAGESVLSREELAVTARRSKDYQERREMAKLRYTDEADARADTFHDLWPLPS